MLEASGPDKFLFYGLKSFFGQTGWMSNLILEWKPLFEDKHK